MACLVACLVQAQCHVAYVDHATCCLLGRSSRVHPPSQVALPADSVAVVRREVVHMSDASADGAKATRAPDTRKTPPSSAVRTIRGSVLGRAGSEPLHQIG